MEVEPVQRGGSCRQRPAAGFSLIELLIVVAIILIVAGIALPNLIRSRMAANEAAAVQALRNITTANVVYSSTYGNGYAPSLAALGAPPGNPAAATCDNANLIDPVLSTGQKSGYVFAFMGANLRAVPASGCTNPGFDGYFARATPLTGTTGQRSFCTDESGVIRFDPTGAVVGSRAACLALTPIQ